MADNLRFDWDAANIEHVGLHGITPDDVEQIFANDAIDLRYEMINGEDRWTSLGHTNQLRILIVVWTMRGESIRPVTAFEGGKKMASEYFSRKG